MTEQAVEVTTTTKIRPNIANMVKTASGSYHKDDFIGTTLAGLTVAQVLTIAVECGLDANKYKHLNPGQQRMTLGNSLRKLTNMVDEAGLEGAALDKAVDANKSAEEVRDQIEELANTAKEANAEAKAAADEAKAQLKADKEAAKAAKAKGAPKVTDSPEGECEGPDE